MSIRAVPTFAKPENHSDSAIRYGYVAYHDIILGSDFKVQPSESPYYQKIPCRELIPFTTITVGEIDVKRYGMSELQGGDSIVQRVKTAKECATEIEQAYQAWNFVVLSPLTGMEDTEKAFRIFQTVQPFAYRLGDIESGLDDAEARIESPVRYQVSYQGESIELDPLSDDERGIARDVLQLVRASASYGVKLANEKADKTMLSMTSRLSGGEGKTSPDPLDKYIAKELGLEYPKIISNQPVAPMQPMTQTVVQTDSPESLELKRRELELREREAALAERKLALEEAQMNGFTASPAPITTAAAPVTTGARKCTAIKTDGSPCNGYAVTNTDRCIFHSQ